MRIDFSLVFAINSLGNRNACTPLTQCAQCVRCACTSVSHRQMGTHTHTHMCIYVLNLKGGSLTEKSSTPPLFSVHYALVVL